MREITFKLYFADSYFLVFDIFLKYGLFFNKLYALLSAFI